MSSAKAAARAAGAALLALAAASLWGAGGGGRPRGREEVRDPHELLASAAAERDDEERGEPEATRTRFMPEMERVVRLLRARVSRPGVTGAVEDSVRRVRAFCRLAYRVLGAEPGALDPEMLRTGAGDAALLRARALNALSSLHLTASARGAAEAAGEAASSFGAHSWAVLEEVRRALSEGRGGGGSALYEAGRGFPSAWPGGEDCEGHWGFSASEARYRVATE